MLPFLRVLGSPADLLASIVLLLFLLLGLLAAIGGVVAGFRLNRRTAAASGATPQLTRWPTVQIIVPCRGDEPGLERNLRALLEQDYPAGKAVVACVVDDQDDPALQTIERLRAAGSPLTSLVVAAAGLPPIGSSGKVQALAAAVRILPSTTQVLAFCDSDGLVAPTWLRQLVATLDEPATGVATTYRWYPAAPTHGRGGAAWHLRSLWNAQGMDVQFTRSGRFVWGGTMVLLRSTFAQADVLGAWQGQVSDDVVLGEAVRRLGKQIAFVPDAMVISDDPTDLGSTFSWMVRQVRLTRTYMPTLWKVGLAASLWLRGAALLAWLLLLGLVLAHGTTALVRDALGWPLVLVACASMPLWTMLRAAQRNAWWRTIARRTGATASTPSVLLAPLATALMTTSLVASAMGRSIHWRGRSYQLPPRGARASRDDGRSGP